MARVATSARPARATSRIAKSAILSLLAIWLALQILIPVRFLLYPGNPSWTEEGHRFAWMMKLRDKKGQATFTVRDPATGQLWLADPWDYLELYQVRKVATRPELVRQFAHHLADHWAAAYGVPDAEVRARVCVSLNGRKAALMIDPTVDLTQVEPHIGSASWILPLNEPFERPPDRRGRLDFRC